MTQPGTRDARRQFRDCPGHSGRLVALILCIFTDNAANMLSTVEKLNLATADEEDIHEVDSLIINENGFLDDNHAIIEEASNLCLIQHMLCAVYTLQLAIRDGLKKHM